MSKRGVMYVKPDEPAFLKRLKVDAGFKEGDTVHTKFENSPSEPITVSDDDSEDPQVVVLSAGDLTKEEADAEKKIISNEIEAKPADLNERVVFKPKVSATVAAVNGDGVKKRKSRKPKKAIIGLSFQDEDDES